MLGFITFTPTYACYNPHIKSLYERLLARGKAKKAVPPCANLFICVSASSKPTSLTKPTMPFRLDKKDSIYAGLQTKWSP